MKAFITVLLALSALSPIAQADDVVQVLINGKSYSCVADNGTPPTTACQDRVAKLEAQYTACRRSRTSTFCFDDVFKKETRPGECDAWFAACDAHCNESRTSTYCYDYCYK